MKLVFAVLVSLATFLVVTQSVGAYEYPIPELGNCRDQAECRLYCDIPSHKAACWSYKVYSDKDILGEESGEDKVAALGISFPIEQLGGCTNIAACKAYCEVPDNKSVCQAFAKSNGLTKKERVVEKAHSELGCTTQEECRTFCTQEENKETCQAFAKKYHLKVVARNKHIEKAKIELGCETESQCKALCSLPENFERCQQFGKKNNAGMERREELVEKAKAELGCTSFDDCKRMCRDKTNVDRCRNFGSQVRQGAVNKIKETGDCATNEACRKECEANPEKCPNFPKKRLNNRGPGLLNSGSLKSKVKVEDDGRVKIKVEEETEIENEDTTDNSGL